ncbi:NAD(P)-dependent oxidoreductase [Streptomyces clavuligerus]|uniref:Beta-hydroxyacid dehydrogenase, 3-hydroxyisobutyrate dehydrogenase n=1 Tax=Streptomyces clavuligerus TaxID=1901 RepID=E2PUR9_STRCL|nr:NAD(P)-binding domain-containing protein [Streptomyces clavuligerus]7Y8K_A Chain A, Beta-hydroxyacid dehydrogenase, 3-hydroxyisobutyrate dehydrogenase [Streptomyces clavuligerus]7Y8K_B Chain B, Beta-hydroxyacid dehydrogenase, 3-hydroxyisobutyrate dehydrogenase [Streptomyces clavuligerus]ANW19370.1 6-phosphogluconate dehydrogenase [Streptomyces clavuligerus]AXU13973.1 NAD(P)-dependent oxidoreductase [Streptomyces clavuligerus]EFG07848.1 Beta-hydroxyacid dehydrogenase, 3-hydroxyisobutyrate de
MSRPAPLTLIGLGPMGQAMGNALLDRGHGLTVWNRTASRADALVERGAVRAPDVAAAVAANELVVLSLTDYDAMYALLGPAADALAGKVVVNLSSDTPEKTRAGARWIAEHGGTLIAGGVTVPPSGIGSPESSAFYSGPSAAFERHRETLRTLTRTDYRGEDPGLAALMYQIGMVMFWNAMLGYWQAVALADANGLKAADILPHASDTVASLPGFLRFYADRIDTGHHGGDVDRLAMGTASVEHILHTMADSGVDTALPEAVVAFFRRGMAAGYAENSFSSMVELLKKPS